MSFGGNLITQIKQLSGRLFERMLLENGIRAFNSAQSHILHVLWQNDDISVHDVSVETGLAMASLSGMLDRMEKGGLIERRRDRKDRRKVRVTLTESAKALHKDYAKLLVQLQDIYYDGFSSQEIEQLEQYLQRILHNVESALHND